MPPKKKFSSGRSKKRRFAGNRYTVKKRKAKNEASIDQESAEETEGSDTEENKWSLSTDATKVKSLLASVSKLDEISGESNSSSSEGYSEGPDGFRLVDISVLSAVFIYCVVLFASMAVSSCKKTVVPRWVLLCFLKCKNQKYKFYEKCYSSSKIEGSQAFEVNRRIVLATKNIGIGHQALAKFTCVMNMPPPMNENSYRDHVAVVRSATQAVCKQSMANAAQEVKTFYEPQEDGKFDIAVSGDGTWRKRGYSSSYGVVTGPQSQVNSLMIGYVQEL